jgi:glycosyltransferase involved in cell wall biosynthesis
MTAGYPPTQPSVVAILGSFPPLRALSNYCLALTRALTTDRQIVFLSFKAIYPSFLYPGRKLKEDNTFELFESHKLKVFRRLTWYNPLTWIKAALTTPAGLLHAQWWSLPLGPIYITIMLGFRLRRLPVVITIHNVRPHERSYLFKMLSGFLYRLGDHFIVHTAQNRRQLLNDYHLDPANVSVIPHGPLGQAISSPLSVAEARKALNLPTDKKLMLLFGAIRPYKGIDTAIKALAALKHSHRDLHMLIAGKRWIDWQPFNQLIKNHGLSDRITTHLRYIPTGDIHLYFQAADLVLLPYHHFDSQSGIGLTAIAYHKPLIVSRTGGLPELVTDKRWVVAPESPADLAEAIAACIHSPPKLQAMRQDAITVAQTFSWETIAAATQNVYETAVGAAQKTRKDPGALNSASK